MLYVLSVAIEARMKSGTAVGARVSDKLLHKTAALGYKLVSGTPVQSWCGGLVEHIMSTYGQSIQMCQTQRRNT